MINESLRKDLDLCFAKLPFPSTGTAERSGWYCIAQWANYYLGNLPLTYDNLWDCIDSEAFRRTLRSCSLGSFAFDEFFDDLFQLCVLIRNDGLVGESATVFYRDYLPFVVTDTSLFSNRTLSFYGNGQVSCTLIYLSLVYAREQMGSRKIFDLLFPEVFNAHKQTLGYLGVSQEEFEHYWNAVHYLDTSSPMHPRSKVKTAIKVYTKMKAPKSMLLFQYAQARHFTPEELRQQDNPWEYVQRKLKSIVPESGMSADEELFNTAGYQISREAPADVIHTIFYGDRDDSRIECAVIRSELLHWMEKTHSILVVNPSPAFLVEHERVRREYLSNRKNASLPGVTYAVVDSTVAYLYNQQFPEHQFILFEQLQQTDVLYDHVVILARDHDTAPLLSALRLCNIKGYVTALLPQSVLTLIGAEFLQRLNDCGICINWILDVPGTLSESEPRKKFLLSGRKLPNYTRTMSLLSATTDRNGEYLVLKKEHFVVPMDWMSKNMTLEQMRFNARGLLANKNDSEPKNTLEYHFSREIMIQYFLVHKNGVLQKARAYYRNIHRPDTEKTRSKGTRPCAKKETERGLRGKTEEEIIPKLENVALYEEFCDDIVADIRDYYKEDLSRLTVKTMWFCCRSELQSRISYDEDMARKFFCCSDQTLSNLVSGDCLPDDIIRAMTALYGENGAGKKQWLQLYLIFQVAVEEGYIERNPLVSFLHVVKDEDRKRLYMLNAALKKPHFTDAEEARMVAFLSELVPLPGKQKRMAPRYVVESKWLAGAFSLFCGIPIREICPLLWGDLHCIEDCVEEMQVYITKHLNSNGVVISNVNYGNKQHFRKVALALILINMLLRRKQYLLDSLGYTEEALAELPIMLDSEPSGRGRRKHTMISRGTALKVNKRLLEFADIPEDVISLLEGEDQFDVNLNAYRNDLFAANFRHKAYHTCGFTAGELSHHVGNRGPDTFSRHYADYNNEFLQYGMVRKLYRWTYLYDTENSVTEPFCCEEVIDGQQEYTTGRFAEGIAQADLTLKPSRDAVGIVRVEVECEHGLNGTATAYSKGGTK